MRRIKTETWAKQLESGKWKQGNGSLNPIRGKYCCLGVAVKLARRDECPLNYAPRYPFLIDGEWAQDQIVPAVLMEALPERVRQNIIAYNGRYRKWSRAPLTLVNDQGGATFPEIAAAIRETKRRHDEQQGGPA